ncbi:hypothetical protein LMB49_10915 [Limosilactobacillus reuteri]|uniref:hypothetical protein n=1 Tax=Limosilactobacillus reuteri TaxID=1598 RepID=UPI001E6026E4|nr:hypothetical protein [Limosilactobacillus reuteri]MCC4371901.1 hypothetical protein [Limosilactobacillus reuteri]MCC4509636.1 hypothetical protein [Limosilactobacillus reuteri]
MTNRYNKVLKIADDYLQISTILPILIIRKLKQGPVTNEEMYNAFGPSNFKTGPLEEATIFTLSQAQMICQSFEIVMERKNIKNFIKPEIVTLGESKLSLKRQLNNIKEIHYQERIQTSSTRDFDTIEHFESLKEQLVSPKITEVPVDLSKYDVESITIKSTDRDVFVANIIDSKANCVKVLARAQKVMFTVETIDKENGKLVKFGALL